MTIAELAKLMNDRFNKIDTNFKVVNEQLDKIDQRINNLVLKNNLVE